MHLDEDYVGDRTESSSPERRLMVAILRRAIWDFALYRDAEEGTERFQLAVDAAGWIFWDGEETLDEEGRYTFKHICMSLDISFEDVRKATLKLTREIISKITHRIETD